MLGWSEGTESSGLDDRAPADQGRLKGFDGLTGTDQAEALEDAVEVEAIEGDRSISGLRLRDVRDGSPRDLDCSAVFVFIGARPRTAWMPSSIALDSKGFILTGADAARSEHWPLTDREPCTVETTCPGVFAAGDVRSKTTKRVAFAVGDGALAVTCAHRVLAEL